MKQIVLDENKNTIDVKDAVASLNANSIIVHINSNNRVTYLHHEPSPVNKGEAGFIGIGFNKRVTVHSCSDTPKAAILKNFNNESPAIYVFDSLEDFARAILENDWIA